MTKKPTTSKKTASNAKKAEQPAVPTIHWDVTLSRPRRRWWVTTLVILVTLWVAGFVVLLQNYGFALVILVGVTACLLLRQNKDEHYTYELTGNTLTEDGKGIDLTEYKAFELQELPTGTPDNLVAIIMFVPKKFFGLGRNIYLPADLEESKFVVAALPDHLTMRNDAAIDGMNRLMNKIIRWLRLS